MKQIKQNRIILIAILIFTVVQLQATTDRCSFQQDAKFANHSLCPSNSECSQNGYCVCNKNYFGNCQNNGFLINTQPQDFTITQNISYFIIVPQIDQYLYYQFNLCSLKQQKNNSYIINFWEDNGKMTTPSITNAIFPDKESAINETYNFTTGPYKFRFQANGQPELLICGIRLKNPGTISIKLSVIQNELFAFDILFEIIFILTVAIGVSMLGGLVFCIFKYRRRGPATLNEQKFDISYFDQYMPSIKLGCKQTREDICAICLGQYKQNQEIRQTMCNHCFHKICLDEWCVTNLSCPNCRTSFQKANLIHHQYVVHSTRQKQLQNFDHLKDSDKLTDVEQKYFEMEENIRKPMI